MADTVEETQLLNRLDEVDENEKRFFATNESVQTSIRGIEANAETALQNEATAREDKDSELSTAISNEETRALAAEKANAEAITNEETRASGEEEKIRSEFANADSNLKSEILGEATEDYSTLEKVEAAIKAEADTARAAEEANANDINDITKDNGTIDTKVADAKASILGEDVTEDYDTLAKIGAKVIENAGAIATLNGDEEGSVNKKVADAVAKILDDAPESFDTLKEVADWISSDTTGAAKMQSDIAKLNGDETTDGSLAHEAKLREDADNALDKRVTVIENLNIDDTYETKSDASSKYNEIVGTVDTTGLIDTKISEAVAKEVTDRDTAIDTAKAELVDNADTYTTLGKAETMIQSLESTVAQHSSLFDQLSANKQNVLTAGDGISIKGDTISAITYSSLEAAENGTDSSLVTTGEKYTWNNKQDALTYTVTDDDGNTTDKAFDSDALNSIESSIDIFNGFLTFKATSTESAETAAEKAQYLYLQDIDRALKDLVTRVTDLESRVSELESANSQTTSDDSSSDSSSTAAADASVASATVLNMLS